MHSVVEQLDAALAHMQKTRAGRLLRCRDSAVAVAVAVEDYPHCYDNDDLWDLSYFWSKRKAELTGQLVSEVFCFSPAQAVEYKPGKYLHSFRTLDALVLKAIALSVQPRLPKSPLCCSYKGFGGVKRALLGLQNIQAGDFLLKTDIANYYASIDHVILMKKLSNYLSPAVLRLIYLALKRLSPLGEAIEQGLARGSALSHVLGNFFLHELDILFFARRESQSYVRYMDDILIHTRTKGALRRADKALKQHIERLNVTIAYRKSFIGRVNKQTAVSFLGQQLSIH